MFELRTFASVAEVGSDVWAELEDQRFPFTRYAFLDALESSGAVGKGSGWLPQHLALYEGGCLRALLPSYLKQHSYGEYVFDMAWANAYHQYGLSYYPKFVSAIPFTPITGTRILMSKGADLSLVLKALQSLIPRYCQEQGLSGWHLLFPEKALSSEFTAPFLQRKAVHFHWHNRAYQSFDDYLADFSSRKRKNLKKERAAVVNAGLEIEVWDDGEWSDDIWRHFYDFYQMTYAKRSGHGGYLSAAFFSRLAEEMRDSIVLMMAKRDGEYVAGALNFKDDTSLYGRYWGCTEEHKFLHFELCYYQGIEYCIKHNLARFDPGVQGEHKIQRGFRPAYTYSNHYLVEEGFHQPVVDFLAKETSILGEYYADASALLPFKEI